MKSYIVKKIFSLPDMDDTNLWLSSVDCKHYTLIGKYLLVQERPKFGRQGKQVTWEERPWLRLFVFGWKEANEIERNEQKKVGFEILQCTFPQYVYVYNRTSIDVVSYQCSVIRNPAFSDFSVKRRKVFSTKRQSLTIKD